MITIAQAISKLRLLKERLERPVDFFAGHIESWKLLAAQTARDVLAMNVPPEIDRDEFEKMAEYVAGQVAAQMLSIDAVGVVIFLGSQQGGLDLGDFQAAADGVATNTLTLQDVTAYVQAGLDGLPGGKPDITDEDRERGADGIAMDIMAAFAKRGFDGAREADVAAFTGQALFDAAKESFPAILEAWVEIFSVVAFDDWKRWVGATARSF